MIRLFVYGTLKRGHDNNERLLSEAKFIGPALSAQPVYKMVTGGYPIVWEAGESGAFLKGEVYEVDDKTLAACDRLEGHPRMYRREERTFNLLPPSEEPNYPGPNKPLPLTAWVYLWPQEMNSDHWTSVEPKNRILDWERPTFDDDFEDDDDEADVEYDETEYEE